MVTIFSLGLILLCSVISSGSVLRQLLLPAKGGIESLSGGAGSYSNVFDVPRHTGGIQFILNLK